MPTENKIAEPAPSLATGHNLDAATWTDFVQRLRYDCIGPRVADHCTSAALFKVENRRIIYGLDMDYTDKLVVYCDDWKWFSPQEYWKDCDRGAKTRLNKLMQEWASCQFMKAELSDQWHVLGELPQHTVTGWEEEWEYVNCHFTYAAAEAFIKRKKHDYRELRIYVDSQYWCWEFEAIKAAILDGTLTYTPKPLVNAHDLVSMEIAG
jgi:hypothetical protein